VLGRLIGCGRIMIGLLSIAAPKLALRLFALPRTEADSTTNLLTRLTGNRELFLGAALALAPEARQPDWLGVSAAIDAGDAVVSLLTLRDGLDKKAALLNAAAGTTYATLELIALLQAKAALAGDAEYD
jgi:hypothetical protein